MSAAHAKAAIFALLADTAARGGRCPTLDAINAVLEKQGLPRCGNLVASIAREGHLIIRVVPKNWRIVEILTGEHAGKSTARPPGPPRRAYMTIGPEISARPTEPPVAPPGPPKRRVAAWGERTLPPPRQEAATSHVAHALPIVEDGFIKAPTRAQLMGGRA